MMKIQPEGLMAKEMIRVNENWNITTALKEMRKQAGEVDEVYFSLCSR